MLLPLRRRGIAAKLLARVLRNGIDIFGIVGWLSRVNVRFATITSQRARGAAIVDVSMLTSRLRWLRLRWLRLRRLHSKCQNIACKCQNLGCLLIGPMFMHCICHFQLAAKGHHLSETAFEFLDEFCALARGIRFNLAKAEVYSLVDLAPVAGDIETQRTNNDQVRMKDLALIAGDIEVAIRENQRADQDQSRIKSAKQWLQIAYLSDHALLIPFDINHLTPEKWP